MAVVVGFHACQREFAESLTRGDISSAEWKPSENPYDWLGKGIYFWERNKRRALQWAAKQVKGKAAIIQAEIELGECLDLADTIYLSQLRGTFDNLQRIYGESGLLLPVNSKSGLRKLDRLVIDKFVESMECDEGGYKIKFDTVSAPFEEGNPVFPGSFIRDQSHVQIAVRDPAMIKAVWLVE